MKEKTHKIESCAFHFAGAAPPRCAGGAYLARGFLFLLLARPNIVTAHDSLFATTPLWQSIPSKLTTSLALGDINGDGLLDLVCGNVSVEIASPENTLYLHDGERLASNPSWASAGREQTNSVALGDIDGDGDLDLVCGNSGHNTLYLNEQGALAETPSWLSQPENDTWSVMLGDVDRDGDLDLVCGNETSKTLYRNDGGTLMTTPVWTSDDTTRTSAIALGDIDGDGRLDLVCASPDYDKGNTLYVNEGDAFSTRPVWTSDSASTTAGIALGDIDGDGALDLVCANDDNDNMVLLNQGGVFSQSPHWVAPEAGSQSVALGDVDRDGDLDLAFGNNFTSNTVYLNHAGTPSATPDWTSLLEYNTKALAMGDLDGDGDLELFYGNASADLPSNDSVYENIHAAGLEREAAWNSFPLLRETEAVAVGDIDGDGTDDLVFGNLGASNTLYLSDGRTFPMSPTWSSPDAYDTYSVALGDVDGDGDLDLACGNQLASNTLYRNDKGRFSDAAIWSPPANGTRAVAFGDLDRDGDLDLVVGKLTVPTVVTYPNEGDNLADQPSFCSEASPAVRGIALGDVNRDGFVDLVCGTREKNMLFFNEGGTFASVPAWTSPERFPTESVTLGDVDGDGDLDLVCSNLWSVTAVLSNVYRNDGGTFTPVPIWSGESRASYGVALGDVDRDGDLDLAFGNEGFASVSGANSLYLNTGRTFGAVPIWLSGRASTHDVAFADIDGDGDLDLAAGDSHYFSTVHLADRASSFPDDPLNPTNHVPNGSAVLRRARIEPNGNLLRIRVAAADVESDPIWILPEYRFHGDADWSPVELVAGESPAGPFATAPEGVDVELVWDISGVPFDDRGVILRLRASEIPRCVSVIREITEFHKEVGRIIPSRPELFAPVDTLSFGSVTQGDTTAISLPIINVGTEDLVITNVQTPSKEIDSAPAPPRVIQPGEVETLTLHLVPRDELDASGDLIVMSNDPLAPVTAIPIVTDIRILAFQSRLLTPAEPAERVPLGQALTVIVTPRPGVRIERGWVFLRPADGFAFPDSVPLFQSAEEFVAIVPGAMVTERGLHYYVKAENSGIFAVDPPGAPDEFFVQSVESPDRIEALVRANVGNDVVAGNATSVQVILSDGIEFHAGTAFYRQGGEQTYRRSTFQIQGRLVSAPLPADAIGPRGLEYYAQIETATTTLTDPAVDAQLAPKIVRTVVPVLHEPTRRPARRYSIVSIPLDFGEASAVTLADLVADDPGYGPYDPTQWRAFRYVSDENIELGTGPPAALHQLRPGGAFWVISRDEASIDSDPVSGVSPSTDTPFPIVLLPGWNQFGHPFAFPVAWDAVTKSSQEIDSLFAFDPSLGTVGDYVEEPPSILTPFQGYFVKNNSSDPETLLIPAVEAMESMTLRAEQAPPAWRLRFTASSTKTSSGNIVLGTHAEAFADFDRWDREKPPSPPGPWVSLGLANRNWRDHAGLYRQDLRDTKAVGHTWNVEILTQEKAQKIVIGGRWDPAPAGELALRLIDLEQSVSIDLRGAGAEIVEHHLVSFGAERPYRLAILAGTLEYVEREGDALVELPVSFSLDANAPNPFREATRIRFGLPDAKTVSLSIFNLEGRRVARLVDQRLMPAGFHTAVWDGRDDAGRRVAAGIYFYRLEAADSVLNRKMLALR